ncbi:type II secretion system F family protein [Ornithinibacillus sp. 4-3]|uniref:Type II secretion system F family protein n=1 Tax=Ornithinibacillus sp. 4-3 TaxID=3231488 RepID=A0AB39HPU2_9BACI
MDKIIGSIAIVILLGIIIFRRIMNSRQQKKIGKDEFQKRQKTISAIRKRTLGGELLIDYAVYNLTIKEKIKYTIFAAIVIFGIAYLFYDSIIFSAILSATGIFYPRFKKKNLIAKRQNELNLQFKEAIASLASSLAAGQSIENAFKEALKDLKLLYPDKNTYIIQEFELITRRIANGEIVERAIDDFANRSNLDDIRNFADVFITCKRTGGDLVEIIKRTADIIADKIEIQQDIRVLVSQKKFESKIMAIAPIGMILFLKTSSPDYVAPLYGLGTPGPVIMTVALASIGVSLLISQKIMDIKI